MVLSILTIQKSQMTMQNNSSKEKEMSNNNYYITEKGYKRQKCSLYLQEKVYKKLIEISEKNELSISECGQRLMVQSMGLIG